jgi:hypothetical protein
MANSGKGFYIVEGRAELRCEKLDSEALRMITDIGAVNPEKHPLSLDTSYRFVTQAPDGLIHEDTMLSILGSDSSVLGRYPAGQCRIGQCRIAGFSSY